MNGKQDIKKLAALFDRDHDRLLRLLDDIAQLCATGSRRSAAKVYLEFRLLQEQHIASEDAGSHHL